MIEENKGIEASELLNDGTKLRLLFFSES